MERLGDEVRRSLRGAGVPDAGALAAVVSAWPEAVGEAIARAAWPARIGRDGTLHVATVSSTWAFELDRLAPEIRKRLVAAIGSEAPAAMRFAPGPVPAPGAVPEAAAEPASPPQPDVEEARTADALTARIEDPELREMVRRAAAASLVSRRSGRPFW